MHHQARTVDLGEKRLRLEAEGAVGQVKLEQIRADPPTVISEVVIAYRHAQANRQVERQPLLLSLLAQVAIEEKIPQGDIAPGRLAQSFPETMQGPCNTRTGPFHRRP